jgi:hypothetical protein
MYIGSMTSKSVSQHASELAKLGAAKGGKARSSTMTPEERSEISRNAVLARWKKEKGPNYQPPQPEPEPDTSENTESKALVPSKQALPHSMFQGTLRLGDVDLECHVLNDGRRVFTQREMVRVLTGGTKTGDLKRYLSRLSNKIADSAAAPIVFKIPGNPNNAFGSEATLLIEICDSYLAARQAGTLHKSQEHLAKKAEIITRACAKIGIIALVDEATGFQQYRAKQALQLKIQAFITDELQEWARMFPEDFWHQLARLEGIRYSPRSRPLRWGRYVMAFVYDAVDDDIGKYLRQINPNPHFKKNHHQWLREHGREKVSQQLYQVIGVMKTCDTMDEFRSKFDRVFKKLPSQMFLDLGLGFGEPPVAVH